MKSSLFKSSLLATAVAMASHSVMAGEAVFYITEDGQAVNNISVTVDGKKKLVGKNGFVTFDLGGGKHSVELSQFGEWAGEFEFNASAKQNAEIQVEMIGGEAVPEISVFTPGQEQQVALGKVSGFLESDETGGGVEGARISVEGTELSTITNGEGYYELEIPRGEYTLNVAHPNYGNREVKNLRVIANVATNVNLNMSMSGDSMIEEVVAVGSYIPSTATAQERDSSAVLDAIGSEQMSRFGDSSAASALKRVAGVSVVGGQYAVVRGMAGRYVSSMLNGSLMPSTDPMKRDVPLDLFPANVLGSIDIQKSFTPNLPGDSTGGSILMTTKGLPSEETSKLSISLGGNSRTTFNDAITYEGGGSDYLGIDDGTRELPSIADKLSDGGKKSINYCPNPAICISDSDAVKLGKSFENTWDTKQKGVQPDFGFSYSFSKFNTMFGYEMPSYGAVSYKSSTDVRHDAVVSDGSTSGTYQRSKYKVDLTGYYVTGIEEPDYSFISKTTLLRKTDDTVKSSTGYDESKDQDIDNVMLQWVERQYFGQQFSGNNIFGDEGEHSVDWRVGFAQTSRYEPDRRSYQYVNGNILVGALERRFSDLTENAFDLGLDYTYETYIGDDVLSKSKVGVMTSTKLRTVDLGRFGIQELDNSNVDQSLSLEEILTDAAFEGGQFGYNAPTAGTDNYEAVDNIVALYASEELSFETVSILAGARMESSTQELTYPDSTSSNNTLDATKVLPMASLNWKPTEEFQFRVGFSQTLSRPGLTERSASVQYDPETDDPLKGNADLEVSDVTNFDVRGEYYFSDDESVTVAVFNKEVTNPIERTVIEGDGNAVDGYTFKNEENATIQGVELDFRINVFEGDSFSSFVAGNFSFIDAEVVLSANSSRLEGIDKRQLQGQSETLSNIQIGFDDLNSGQSLTFLINQFDDRIYATSRGVLAPEVEDGRTTFDIVYSYDVNESFVVKAKAKNITDEEVSFSRDGRVIESYSVGSDYSVSLDYLF